MSNDKQSQTGNMAKFCKARNIIKLVSVVTTIFCINDYILTIVQGKNDLSGKLLVSVSVSNWFGLHFLYLMP